MEHQRAARFFQLCSAQRNVIWFPMFALCGNAKNEERDAIIAAKCGSSGIHGVDKEMLAIVGHSCRVTWFRRSRLVTLGV